MENITQGFNIVADTKDKHFCSYFKSAKSTKKVKDIYFSEYLNLLSDTKRKEDIDELRDLPADQYKKRKVHQPCVTASCITQPNGRSLKHILELNGNAVIDIDILPLDYDDWQELKNTLAKDKFTFLIHFSLSGKGLCIFVKIPIENNFNEIYLSFQQYYKKNYDVNIDLLADQTRLRFISYDPEYILNENAEVYTDVIKGLKPVSAPAKCENSDFIPTTPAEIFNNAPAAYEVVKDILLKQGFDCVTGNAPVFESFTRPGGGAKGSIVSFDNQEVNKWEIHSTSCILPKGEYNNFGMYKGFTGLTDFEAQKELAALGFGEFHNPVEIIGKRSETYSLVIDFVERLELKLNTLTGIKELNRRPLNDADVSVLLTQLSLETGKNQSKEILLTVLDVVALSRKYDPVLTYIDEKLKRLEPTDFSKPTELDKFVSCWTGSTDKELMKIYLTRWLLGLFDLTLLDKMTKLVLVLSGAQNSCKTSTGQNILPDELRGYARTVDFNRNKLIDCKISLCSSLISTFDEFESIFNHAAVLADFKNVSASKEIYERRPYGRFPEVMQRRSLIIGTSNFSEILTDPTGNMRFCTIDVQAFDLQKYFTVDLDRLWRVVYDLHLAGETSNLTEQEKLLQIESNESFTAVDIYEELIQNNCMQDPESFATSTDVFLFLEPLTKQKLSVNRIGAVLKKLNFERVSQRVDGYAKKGYLLKFKM